MSDTPPKRFFIRSEEEFDSRKEISLIAPITQTPVAYASSATWPVQVIIPRAPAAPGPGQAEGHVFHAVIGGESGAPTVIRCLWECLGQLRAHNRDEWKSFNHVIVTANTDYTTQKLLTQIEAGVNEPRAVVSQGIAPTQAELLAFLMNFGAYCRQAALIRRVGDRASIANNNLKERVKSLTEGHQLGDLLTSGR